MWQGAAGLPLAYHLPLMSGSVPARTSVHTPKAIVKLAQTARILAIFIAPERSLAGGRSLGIHNMLKKDDNATKVAFDQMKYEGRSVIESRATVST
jgi:hypothetical protein